MNIVISGGSIRIFTEGFNFHRVEGLFVDGSAGYNLTARKFSIEEQQEAYETCIAINELAGKLREQIDAITTRPGCWNPGAEKCDCPACGGFND